MILFIIVHFQQGRSKFTYSWLGNDEEDCQVLVDKQQINKKDKRSIA